MIECRAAPNIEATDISTKRTTNCIHECLGLDNTVAQSQRFHTYSHGSFARQLLREDPCRECTGASHWLFKRINPLPFIFKSESLTQRPADRRTEDQLRRGGAENRPTMASHRGEVGRLLQWRDTGPKAKRQRSRY